MATKLFVCLANSKKHGGRCVAGIEVLRNGAGSYDVVNHGWEPKWIRPVSTSSHGEISTALANTLQLLDVVEMDVVKETGVGYQSENATFRTGELRVVGRVPKTPEVLSEFVSPPQNKIFGNRGKAVHIDKIDELDHSLMLIRAENAEFHRETSSSGNPQVRATFEFGGHDYDFPITDPEFEREYLHNAVAATRAREYYFTLSLGLEYGDFHYKLIAAVLGV